MVALLLGTASGSSMAALPLGGSRPRAPGASPDLICTSRRSSAALLLVASASLAACDTSPAVPEAGELTVAFLASEDLRGLGGELLPQWVTAVVTDPEGRPRPGVRLEIRVLEGGGAVDPPAASTDTHGRVLLRWILGPAERPIQRLEARIADRPGAPGATVEATALGPHETDIALVRGARGPLKGLLVLTLPKIPFAAGDIRQEWARSDTVIPLQPISGGTHHILVFPTANALVLHEASFTAGVDTITIDLPPPVRLDLRIRIFAGPFDERKAVAEAHLTAAQEIWEQEGVGVTFGTVNFEDRSEAGDTVRISGGGLCSTPVRFVTSEILVDYVHSINNDAFGGWGCAPNRAWMGIPSQGSPRLLAHELGHVFTLWHTSSGVMEPRSPGTELTEGQIFQVHFHEHSAVNAVFGANPPEPRFPCVGTGSCVGVSFRLRR
jgi:hypothetical protein